MADAAELIDLQKIEHVALSQPLLRGLLRDLRPAHTYWSKKERQEWFELAEAIFVVLYSDCLPTTFCEPEKL